MVALRSPSKAYLKDDDGDLVVPRRQQHTRRRRDVEQTAEDSEETAAYTLESSPEAAAWNVAGSQLWRAALLLADFVLANTVRVAKQNQ